MKTLLLIRHAKSSWDNPGDSDFDRPLNARGKADAPDMASRLRRRKIAIDLFISSPAKRAKKTAEIFIREFNRDEKEINLMPILYEAEMQTFHDLIAGLQKRYQSVAIFGHNPVITDFANSLSDFHLDNIPTCGIFAVTAAVEKWREFQGAYKNFLFFDYPKGD